MLKYTIEEVYKMIGELNEQLNAKYAQKSVLEKECDDIIDKMMEYYKLIEQISNRDYAPLSIDYLRNKMEKNEPVYVVESDNSFAGWAFVKNIGETVVEFVQKDGGCMYPIDALNFSWFVFEK